MFASKAHRIIFRCTFIRSVIRCLLNRRKTKTDGSERRTSQLKMRSANVCVIIRCSGVLAALNMLNSRMRELCPHDEWCFSNCQQKWSEYSENLDAHESEVLSGNRVFVYIFHVILTIVDWLWSWFFVVNQVLIIAYGQRKSYLCNKIFNQLEVTDAIGDNLFNCKSLRLNYEAPEFLNILSFICICITMIVRSI